MIRSKVEFIWEELRDLWKKVSSFFDDVADYIARVIEYSPILWRDRDFDYRYILELLKYKLERTRKHITEHQIIQAADEVGAEIAHAEELLRRILKDDYCTEEQDAHDLKWGEIVDLSHPSEDHPGYYEWDMRRENATTQELEDQENTEQREIYERKELARELDMDELFVYMRKHVERWWD